MLGSDKLLQNNHGVIEQIYIQRIHEQNMDMEKDIIQLRQGKVGGSQNVSKCKFETTDEIMNPLAPDHSMSLQA